MREIDTKACLSHHQGRKFIHRVTNFSLLNNLLIIEVSLLIIIVDAFFEQAGLVLNPMSHISYINKLFFPVSSINYYEVVSFFCRMLFMFLFGLEMNFQYTFRNLRLVSLVACGGALMGGVFGLSVSFYLVQQLQENDDKLAYFCMIIMLVVSYTSSPMVIRLAAELRFAASDVGRIAVSSALITEMGCLLFFNLMVNWKKNNHTVSGLSCFVITGVVCVINRYSAVWLNARHRNQKYLKAPELLLILFLLLSSSMLIEILGYNSIIHCFIVGLSFPKEGKTARTLVHKLGYSIYNFVLPVYFGYLGLQCDLINIFGNLDRTANTAILVLLSIGSKLGGTLIVCRYLKIPTSEGIFLGFILNTRGYADLLFIGAAAKQVIVSVFLGFIELIELIIIRIYVASHFRLKTCLRCLTRMVSDINVSTSITCIFFKFKSASACSYLCRVWCPCLYRCFID